MATFTLAKNGVAAASGAAYATLHTGANPIKIVEFSIFLTTAVATSIGIVRAANTPVATTSTLLQGLAAVGPASTTNFDTTWSTAPTISTNEFLQRIVLPAATSAGLIKVWRPDAPLEVAANSWLVFWNFGGSTGAIPSIGLEVIE